MIVALPGLSIFVTWHTGIFLVSCDRQFLFSDIFASARSDNISKLSIWTLVGQDCIKSSIVSHIMQIFNIMLFQFTSNISYYIPCFIYMCIRASNRSASTSIGHVEAWFFINKLKTRQQTLGPCIKSADCQLRIKVWFFDVHRVMKPVGGAKIPWSAKRFL